eukprot:5000863-Amphidinium_carterae.1
MLANRAINFCACVCACVYVSHATVVSQLTCCKRLAENRRVLDQSFDVTTRSTNTMPLGHCTGVLSAVSSLGSSPQAWIRATGKLRAIRHDIRT